MKPLVNNTTGKYYQGRYRVKNPSKYRGEVTNVIYRSSWESKFMIWCDHNPNVMEWSSEQIVIPYVSPVDGRFHRYFVDFYIKIKDKNGNIKRFLVEVKPKSQTMPPTGKKKTQRLLKEALTYEVNKAKWEAAEKFCLERDMHFIILTEEQLKV